MYKVFHMYEKLVTLKAVSIVMYCEQNKQIKCTLFYCSEELNLDALKC